MSPRAPNLCKVLPARLVPRGRLAHLDLPDRRDHKVLLVCKDHRVSLGLWARKGRLAKQVRSGQRVPRAMLDLQAVRANPDLLDRGERLVLLVPPGRLAPRAKRVNEEKPDLSAQLDLLVPRGRLVPRVSRAKEEQLDPPAQLDLLDLQGHLDLKGRLDPQVQQAHLAKNRTRTRQCQVRPGQRHRFHSKNPQSRRKFLLPSNGSIARDLMR